MRGYGKLKTGSIGDRRYPERRRFGRRLGVDNFCGDKVSDSPNVSGNCDTNVGWFVRERFDNERVIVVNEKTDQCGRVEADRERAEDIAADRGKRLGVACCRDPRNYWERLRRTKSP